MKDAPLSQVLQKGLAGTSLHYAIDGNRVYITKERTIRLALPDEYFARKTADPATPKKTDEVIDYQQGAKPVQEATLENKLYAIGTPGASSDPTVNLAGYIRNTQTGEPVIGVSVYVDKPKRIGVATDQYGYYSINLPRGRHILHIQSIGMRDTRRQIQLNDHGKLNIELQEQIISLKHVTITGEKAGNVRGTQMGVEKLSIKTIKQVPTVFGEADILRVMLTLPGVKSVGEASTGFNVRGGAADQNLILFNDATIYNPSHFFGMFSAFNPEVVKSVELYKSSVPAKYGGRLSSVLDVAGREGNKKKFAGVGGIGLLTSRINLEGPLITDRSSFVFGARTTYANWMLNLLPQEYEDSKVNFYDVNLLLSHEDKKKKNTFFLTTYLSRDRFNLNSDTTYGYGNKNISFKWKHIFNSKFSGTLTTGYDFYDYNINSDALKLEAYKMKFDIGQGNLKFDFNYYLNAQHTLDFGVSSILYKLHPGSFEPVGKESLVVPDIMAPEQGLESAAYLSDRWTITDGISLDAGIRWSMFNYIGPRTINYYAPGLSRSDATLVESKAYNRGDFINNYNGPEFRVGGRFATGPASSIKASYNTSRQYIHMLSNTTAIAPTDVWKLSDPNIKPQRGEQASLGFYKNFRSNTIETSVEVYYKKLHDYLDYKSGASLVLNHKLEQDVINTKGKAYGVELMVKKLTGKLNGWISYTYSRTLLKVDDPTTTETVNQGNFYPSNYDKPHDVTMVGNYRFSHRVSASMNTTYSTGRPITLPIGKFEYAGAVRTLYSDRNAYRIPDYFRMDLSLNIEGNHKVHQKTHNSWTFGVYNLTARRNAYSVYFVSENGYVKGYKLSIFGAAIPFVNFNIRF
ncbi:TonB-dependent receptor [Chitinophaga horti]|uniref:TonB-dependent receptor n=1 Tax=Chitinophaga horti TaxID=2920382 RepID=A0ABY6J5T2_9BACT|nr:TonB-dependent receptor [Chitinophaga horti]UYQ95044.1 TonB-dependent receptor [Chitinophaga horti]